MEKGLRKLIPKELRKFILRRDNYLCRHCGENKYRGMFPLEIHHIDKNSDNNDPNNLITLCVTCHNSTKSDKFPTHGTSKGGRIKGRTDTDYFHFICPSCNLRLNLYLIKIRDDNVYLIGIKCKNCSFKDLIKISFEGKTENEQ